MKRRTFIATLGSALCFWLLVPTYRIRHMFTRFKKDVGLSAHDISTLAYIAEYIYPEDHDSAGALSLGIETFFTKQFQTHYYQKHILALKRLVIHCDKEANRGHHKKFKAIERKNQFGIVDSILLLPQNNAQFGLKKDLNNLIDVTLEGCFAHPEHGGNKGKQAWTNLGDTFKEEWLVG